MAHVQRAHIPVRANEAGRIHDPAIDQLLEAVLRTGVKGSRLSQRMQIAIGVQPQFRRRVIPGRQLLTGIAEGLEMTDGFRVV